MKKLLSFLLAFTMILSVCTGLAGISAAAEEEAYSKTILSLCGQSDISDYGWYAAQASLAWDNTENAAKFSVNNTSEYQRLQTGKNILVNKDATITVSFKGKGFKDSPSAAGYYINGTDMANINKAETSDGSWMSFAAFSKTDIGDGWYQYTGSFSFSSVSESKYLKIRHFWIAVQESKPDSAYDVYVKDLKVTTNKSPNQRLEVIKQISGPGINIYETIDCLQTSTTITSMENGFYSVTNSDTVPSGYYGGWSVKNREYNVNSDYVLSFYAWKDPSVTKALDASLLLFDAAASNYGQWGIGGLSTTKTHYDIAFTPKKISTYAGDTNVEKYSTPHLQMRLTGNTGEQRKVYFTDVALKEWTRNGVETQVKKTDGGALSVSDGYIESVKGEKVSLDVTPDEGYEIESVTYNDSEIDIADKTKAANVSFVTNSDAVLNVKFSKIVPKDPSVSSVGAAIKYKGFLLNSEYHDAVNYVQYVKIENFDKNKISAAGVDISDGTDSLRLPVDEFATDGAFAVRVFGSAITEDGTYVFTPFIELK